MVGLEELSGGWAQYVRTNLPQGWSMTGTAHSGSWMLWDCRGLVVVEKMREQAVFPDSGSDRYRSWRTFLQAR